MPRKKAGRYAYVLALINAIKLSLSCNYNCSNCTSVVKRLGSRVDWNLMPRE